MLLVRQSLENKICSNEKFYFSQALLKLTTKSPLLLAQSREPDEQFLVISDIIGCWVVKSPHSTSVICCKLLTKLTHMGMGLQRRSTNIEGKEAEFNWLKLA